MGRAKLYLTGEFVRDLLHLPLSANVLGSVSVSPGMVGVIVEHDEIPASENGPDGLPSLIVSPVFRKQREVVFEGWNPKDH